MKKIVLIVFMAILPGLVGGCFGNKADETATTQETPSPNASPSPSATQTPPFGQGGQPGSTSSTNIDIAGLIPSTPPSEVPVQKGRSDPFGMLPVRPTITADPTKVPINPQPSGTSVPTTASIPQTSSTPRTSNPKTSGNSKTQSSRLPANTSKKPVQSPLAKAPIIPPPPVPTEAMAVYVSGVVGLSTRPVAIIKAPGENVERTVTPGTFLANGQVLVKAIYAYSDSPIVIFEQYGIEVAKKVGEAPVETKAPETPEQQTPANPEQS